MDIVNYRMSKVSYLFLYCFACFLELVAIICVFTKSNRIEMIASIASVSGLLFTVADLYGSHKNDSERINSMLRKANEKDKELRDLQSIRINKMKLYCQAKYEEYSTTSKINKESREPVVSIFKKALIIMTKLDDALESMRNEEEAKKAQGFPKKLFCRYNRNRLMRVGIARDFFLVAGFMSILCMLAFYEIFELPSMFSNYLTVVGFGLIMIIYASRDRAEELQNIATKFSDERMEEIKGLIENEQRFMRWMETALYQNEEDTSQEAEIKLLIYISDFVDVDEELR